MNAATRDKLLVADSWREVLHRAVVYVGYFIHNALVGVERGLVRGLNSP